MPIRIGKIARQPRPAWGAVRWVGGRRRGAVREVGRRPSPDPSRRHAAGSGLPSCGSLARAGRGPGRMSEGGAGTVYPKGENSLAPEAANRKGDRGPERSGSDAFLPTAARNGAAAFRTPISRAAKRRRARCRAPHASVGDVARGAAKAAWMERPSSPWL
jgi:hypothetical protein